MPKGEVAVEEGAVAKDAGAEEEVEVAAVPGEAFGTPGYLRFSYALGDDDITEGIGRIAKLVADS